MEETRRFLQGMNLPSRDLHNLPDSPSSFMDGTFYRVEVPGVESPAAMSAVIDTARELDLTVHRVTALGGIVMLPDRDIREMADLGAAQRIEVCLTAGLPADEGIAGTTGRLAGVDSLVHAVEDVRRAVDLGIRAVAVADEGLLWVLREMKTSGLLPEALALRASRRLGARNPASIWLLEELGAASYAVPPDLGLAGIAAVRAAVDIPLEIAVDAAEARHGVRLYDVPEVVRVAAPVYLCYDLDAGTGALSGAGVPDVSVALCRERVRHARLGQNMLERYLPRATASVRGAGGVSLPVYVAG